MALGDLDSFATGEPTRVQTSTTFESATAAIDKTSAVVVPSSLGRSVWPSVIELGDALLKDDDRFSWQLAVFLDGKPYTQMVVSQQAVRVGTDARCELALPKKAGLAGWQMTFVDFGQSILCIRASADARVVVDDVPIDQAVLQAKDVVVMGRVRIEVLRR
ncbi:MAG: hypothetical protein GY822_17120 [Deltaproteobacteria bacterium]|nr:hypothetical protein [Deltaproteobacteria bacterium]